MEHTCGCWKIICEKINNVERSFVPPFSKNFHFISIKFQRNTEYFAHFIYSFFHLSVWEIFLSKQSIEWQSCIFLKQKCAYLDIECTYIPHSLRIFCEFDLFSIYFIPFHDLLIFFVLLVWFACHWRQKPKFTASGRMNRYSKKIRAKISK